MSKIYGYCRISTTKQSIERQIRNIQAENSKAIIVQDVFTGRKENGRKEWLKLLKRVKAGDTIIFDSVSRMSRNAEEGTETYFKLMDQGVELVFLKERYIDTEIYRNESRDRIALTGIDEDEIFQGINNYFRKLAKRQIKIAFDQAEKEVEDLRQRTREGIETARLNGKQIGHKKGSGWETKKESKAKEVILKYNKTFGGNLNNQETWTLAGISSGSFYKYKRKLKENKYF